MDLEAAYRACAGITRRRARNFYFAFLSLPKIQRRSVYVLYAFCREADDAVDAEPVSGTRDAAALADREVETKRAVLDSMRARLARAADQDPETARDLALADTLRRFGVDPADLEDVLTGMELDLTQSRMDTAEDLDRYCYHAAAAVGLATLPILTGGAPPTKTMREAAIDLGIGMQYVNILRDVAEDLDRDRLYLPLDELDRFGITPASLGNQTLSDPLRAMLAAHGARARGLLDRGRQLVPLLPRRSRSCPWLLAEIYGRVLERIAERDYDVFAGRVSLPGAEKVGLLLATRWRQL